MAEPENEQARPCLHCLMVEPSTTSSQNEIIEAVAKIASELTSRQNGIFRQHLMRQIMKFDGEFRRGDAAGSDRSTVRH